jgi:hypothetical protein
MDFEKLNMLCDEARLRTRDITGRATIAQNAKTDAEKLINLMFVMKGIRKLEKTKEQIVKEVRVAEEEAKTEIKCARNILSEISTGMLVSLSQAIYCDNAEERIIRLDEVLLNFGKFETQIRHLEILRERLNLEEEENEL